MLTRRTLLVSAAVTPLAGCTAAQIAQFQSDWSNFVDKVNAILAKGCGLLPGFISTANSIEAVVGQFYASGAAAIAAGAAAIAAVASAICSTIPTVPPAALRAKLRTAAATGVPTIVGNVTINGRVIPITGYGVR
jgi:hypothetical protein